MIERVVIELKKLILTLLALCLIFSCVGITVSAGESTTYTYTLSVDKDWIRTQDAYMSGQVYFKGAGLSAPKDVFCFEDKLYVADSGNSRVIVLNTKTGDTVEIGKGVLASPSGVFVTEQKEIYVADGGIPAVVIFDENGNEKRRIERPDSFLFSKDSKYEPKNVVVTSQGNIFVVGLGSYSGIMRFDRNGVFQGYFAPNKRGLSLLETLQESVFNETQKDQMVERIPRSIENIDLADRDMIYSVTQGEYKVGDIFGSDKIQNYLKLHNMGGLNILSSKAMVEEWNFVDVAKGNSGNVYALTATGLIYEYDSAGNLVFSFGGRAVSSDRAGLFTVASAIDVSADGIIYVLDEERGFIQTFYPTQFADVTHLAIEDLESGNYESSEEIWSSVLKLNGNSSIAHLGYGKALLHQGRYEEAMEHFKICGDKEYYSQAFWEIRSRWLNENVVWIVIGVIAVAVLGVLYKRFGKKSGISDRLQGLKPKKGIGYELTHIFSMITHPIDTYYEIKCSRKGNVLSATVIYLLFFIIFVFDILLRGYLFSSLTIKDIPVFSVPLMFFIPLALWIFGNNMVSSINEGEGTFKSIYISSAYMFAPYIVLTPIAVLLTYVLSLNEAFIVTLIWTVGIIWTAVLVILNIMEIHNYSFGQAIKNLLLIAFFMIMAVVAIAIIYLIWTQVFGYLEDVFGEAKYRIFGN